ncbi:hypothetical protein Sme01_39390 [Sphaerisporangium melleum]|uniref:DUF4230 domain-containing protein n=1 Tax=Sphaerisporangium melleum TaxID=321316 RepID=A0A917R385_9ACTN|nr:DUF4230 domain-containing protein [Sphaerisporangium melleum]GGK86106.1 hypothetical protein GCM10007964_30810 [Sphaerisporangium melleum]GII71463.1 hypothetical protein Sme01_39390 [Sphaerisporangium melleum]
MNRQTSPPQTPTAAQPGSRRSRRGWRYLAGVLTVLVLLLVGAKLAWSYLNPLADRTIDRSQPALLLSIQNMSRFEAATGDFQVIVDLEKDAPFLPDAVKGSRTLFVGAGGVDAYVDFSRLAKDAITVSPDRTEVTVRIPHAQLEKPNLDNKRSYVFAQQRGLLDRVQDMLSSSPQNQQELYVLAEQKIAEAARASDLRARADQNTKLMLEGMLKALGFTKVTIVYTADP